MLATGTRCTNVWWGSRAGGGRKGRLALLLELLLSRYFLSRSPLSVGTGENSFAFLPEQRFHICIDKSHFLSLNTNPSQAALALMEEIPGIPFWNRECLWFSSREKIMNQLQHDSLKLLMSVFKEQWLSWILSMRLQLELNSFVLGSHWEHYTV